MERVTSVRLPDGSSLPVSHQTTVTVHIDRQYTADVTFLLLPLKGIGAILGMPWLHRHGVVIDHANKSATFEHRGRRVHLLPVNPVLPVPPPEPLVVNPPAQPLGQTAIVTSLDSQPRWVSLVSQLGRSPLLPLNTALAAPAPVHGLYAASSGRSTPWMASSTRSAPNSHRSPSVLPDPRRRTHLPGPTEARSLLTAVRDQFAAARQAYEEDLHEHELALLAGTTSPVPPSVATLSSMNVFDLVEVNSAPLFQRALALMTTSEADDCGVLYMQGTGADDMEISDLPFSTSYLDLSSQLVAHLPYMPIFSLSPATTPMANLPSKPVLSIPDYLDGIQQSLNVHSSTLLQSFEKILMKFSEDVFPDPHV